ncbi:hypothetical protein N9W34_00210 [Rickettsiales bacterium]|nr:hypothetical protein [Rickettsiales bacterium]
MPNAFHYQNTFADPMANCFRNILSTDFVPPFAHKVELWLDAHDTKTHVFNSEGQLTTWKDKSGKQRNAIRADASVGSVNLGSINGVKSLSFETASLNLPNLGIAPPITAFIVFHPNNAATIGYYPEYLYIDGSQFNPTGRKPMVHGVKPNPNDIALQFGYYSQSKPILDNAPNILKLSTDNEKFLTTVNSTNYSSNIGSTKISATSNGGRIGAGGGFATWGELLIYQTILPESEIIKIWSYLFAKWRL